MLLPTLTKPSRSLGGTGSPGNFVVRRLLDLGAHEVRVLSRDEKKQYDMRVFYQQRPDLHFVTHCLLRATICDEPAAS